MHLWAELSKKNVCVQLRIVYCKIASQASSKNNHKQKCGVANLQHMGVAKAKFLQNLHSRDLTSHVKFHASTFNSFAKSVKNLEKHNNNRIP